MKLSWVHSISPQKSHLRLESSRATLAKPVRRGISRWSIRVWSVPSGFIKIVLDVSSVWVPLSAFVLRSPAEVNLSPLEETTSPHHHPLPAARPGGQFHSGQRLTFGGSSLTLFKGVGPRIRSSESYSGVWGILVHPSPPGWAYLQPTSIIGKIFSSLHMG